MCEMSEKDHWEHVYMTRPSDKLGWYKAHLPTSVNWIKELGLAVDDPIIDVGGATSSLVDELLETGYRSISVVDISEEALSLVKNVWAKNQI